MNRPAPLHLADVLDRLGYSRRDNVENVAPVGEPPTVDATPSSAVEAPEPDDEQGQAA